MAQTGDKTAAMAAWEALRPKDSSLKQRAEAVLQRAYGRTDSPAAKPKKSSSPPGWMISLGMVPKKINAAEASSSPEEQPKIQPGGATSVDQEDARRAAVAACATVKSAPSQKVAVPSPPESDAAAKSSETGEKRPSSGLDSILEQIQKKSKGNILDKSRTDWGEFKEEKGLTEELEAYKKSGDKYLDKVAFLQRTDDREYEKERDARLEYQAKRRLAASYRDN